MPNSDARNTRPQQIQPRRSVSLAILLASLSPFGMLYVKRFWVSLILWFVAVGFVRLFDSRLVAAALLFLIYHGAMMVWAATIVRKDNRMLGDAQVKTGPAEGAGLEAKPLPPRNPSADDDNVYSVVARKRPSYLMPVLMLIAASLVALTAESIADATLAKAGRATNPAETLLNQFDRSDKLVTRIAALHFLSAVAALSAIGVLIARRSRKSKFNSEGLRFSCPFCRLSLNEIEIGKVSDSFLCPKCHRNLAFPRSREGNLAYPIFHCSLCNEELQVESGDVVGSPFACPECDGQIAIPSPVELGRQDPGKAGQANTVDLIAPTKSSWTCSCGEHNLAMATECRKCHLPRR